VIEPADNRPYDPLAEAIGWLVRACAEVEFWLNIIAARVESTTFRDAVWIRSGEKTRLLRDLDPELGPLADRTLELLEIRNTLAHGITHQVHGLCAIDLQVQPTSRDASYRRLRLSRTQLVALADEAHDTATRLQHLSSVAIVRPTDES